MVEAFGELVVGVRVVVVTSGRFAAGEDVIGPYMADKAAWRAHPTGVHLRGIRLDLGPLRIVEDLTQTPADSIQ